MIVAPLDLPKALADLSTRPHLDEVVLLSTCVRTEAYAVVSRFHGAMATSGSSGLERATAGEFSDSLYRTSKRLR